jgi:hypothetical protein
MTGEVEVVTLSNLCGGAVLERFQMEWAKVLENIADPNTEADAPREIKVTIKVRPDAKREVGTVEVTTACKLPSLQGVTTTIFMARHHGENVAVEQNPRQLLLEGLAPSNLVPMEGGRP